MPTTFLLDPRVLDDCVNDSAKDVEIVGEVVGYSKFGLPEYVFYFNYSKEKQKLPTELVDLALYRKDEPFASIYTFSRALILTLPADTTYFNQDFKVLYAFGKFLKGDVEALKNYGIKIKSQ